jgi:hypothetical protein
MQRLQRLSVCFFFVSYLFQFYFYDEKRVPPDSAARMRSTAPRPSAPAQKSYPDSFPA